MKKLTAVVLLALLLAAPAAGADEFALPELDGFAAAGDPGRYDPETLFEYINGKAGSFLDFGFQELITGIYAGDGERLIRADVYRHDHPDNGFGIYSSERPRKPGEPELDGAGYFKKGKLNFYRGAHYVKLVGENLGEEAHPILRDLAGRIAESLGDDPGLPVLAACLPAAGQESYSLRYIARGFLGHSFLNAAFTADYETEAGSFRAFILVAADEAEAGVMLASYEELARSKGEVPVEVDGIHRFHDPYRAAEGMLNLAPSGRHVVGLFMDDETAAAAFAQAVHEELARLEE